MASKTTTYPQFPRGSTLITHDAAQVPLESHVGRRTAHLPAMAVAEWIATVHV